MPANVRVEDPWARIEALEAEIERLQDYISVLEEAAAPPGFIAPQELRLTGSQARLLGRLLRGDVCTKPAIMNALYSARGGVDEEPQMKIVDVFLCKLRQKLKPFGLTIHTVWGIGYQMPSESIAKFRARWPDNLDAGPSVGG